MEALTTIWKYDVSINKWIRVVDVVISQANTKLVSLKLEFPNISFKISDNRPRKK